LPRWYGPKLDPAIPLVISPHGRGVPPTEESGRLYRAIEQANPNARVTQVVGTWEHSREMDPLGRLPLALLRLQLIKLDEPLPTAAKP
jgi:hypothetical protein